MKTTVSTIILVCCVVGLSEVARAEGGGQVRPVDFYVSGFGGYSFPLKTDVSSGGITATNAELDNSPSFGGKVGVWFTAPRRKLGFDIGAEIDVTHMLNPDLPGGQVLNSNAGLVSPIALDLTATYYGIHVLGRIPMGVTPELPNGRWFPYIGVGGGGQVLRFQAAGTTEGTHTAPAFQGFGGIKVFLSKHVALFAEGKFIHASHTLEFQGGGGSFTVDLTMNTVHGVGGLSLHF